MVEIFHVFFTRRRFYRASVLFTIFLLIPGYVGQSQPAENQTSQKTAVTTARDGLRLRAAPGLRAKIKGLIPHNSPVRVLQERGRRVSIQGKKGRWTKVNWNGSTGWVFGGFLQPVGPPRLVIDSPSSGWIAADVITIRGRLVNNPGNQIREVKFIFNGAARYVPLRGNRFSQQVSLGPGANYLRVEAKNQSGLSSTSLKLLTNNAQMDMRMVLTWDTDHTYMDLYITDPRGETVNWKHPRSKIGGKLIGWNIIGFGPQIFTLPRAIPGEYKVQVKYYLHSGRGEPTMVKLLIVLYQGTPREKRYVFPGMLAKNGDILTVATFRVD